MRTRNLPETDLARVAPLSRERKRVELEKIRDVWPPYSYRRFRRSIPDIVQATSGLLTVLSTTSWEAIEYQIRRPGSSATEIEANIQVAKGLYDYATQAGIRGRQYDFFPLNIGISEKVTYWSSIVLNIQGRPVVPYFDPRRSKKLTAEARRFVFSVMHERIRILEPDLVDARLAIVQFQVSESIFRAPIIHFDDGIDLYSFTDLDNMVRETYELWREVLAKRKSDARRSGGGGGSLI